MKKMFRFLGIVLLAVSSSAYADVPTANSILTRANNVAQGAIESARGSGDALLARAANELLATSDAVRFGLEESLGKTIDNLDTSSRNALGRIDKMTDSLEGFAKQAYDLKDTTVIDTRELLNSFPFIEKIDFYVQRVDGLASYASNTSHAIRMLAVNVGPDTDKRRTTFVVKLDDTVIELERIERSAAGQATFVLPQNILRKYQNNERVSVVPVEIDVNIEKKKLLGWRKARTYPIKLYLSVYPDRVATLIVNGKSPAYSWVYDRNECFAEQGPSAHCSSGCGGHYGVPTTRARSVAGGDVKTIGYQRISKITDFRQVDGPVGYDADQSSQILNNAATVQMHWRARTHATTYRLCYDVEKYQATSSVPFPTMTQTLNLNEPLVVRVPREAKEVIITGTSITNKPISIVIGASNSDPTVELATEAIDNNERVLIFRAKPVTQ